MLENNCTNSGDRHSLTIFLLCIGHQFSSFCRHFWHWNTQNGLFNLLYLNGG